MRVGEFRRGALLSASAVALTALLGTAAVHEAAAQATPPGQGAPSYTPGQTGGPSDSTGMTRNRAPTTSPRQRQMNGDPNNPTDPSVATGRRPADSTNMNSPSRTPTAPMDTDTGNDPGGRNQP